MLQMNCSNCGGLIKSPLLAEVQLFVCPQCKEIVVVEEVVIATSKISIDLRQSLKNLLLFARDKFHLNKVNNADAHAKYDVNKRLAKLMRRDDFRLNISYDLFVRLNFNGNKRQAKLLNISSTGAAIQFFELGQLPENDSEIDLQLIIPQQSEPLSFLARVVWSGKSVNDMDSPTVTIGLHFKNIDEKVRSCLWEFIVDSETSVQK